MKAATKYVNCLPAEQRQTVMVLLESQEDKQWLEVVLPVILDHVFCVCQPLEAVISQLKRFGEQSLKVENPSIHSEKVRETLQAATGPQEAMLASYQEKFGQLEVLFQVALDQLSYGNRQLEDTMATQQKEIARQFSNQITTLCCLIEVCCFLI